jgi:predicted RNase H-like HicB family nuclease
MRQTLAKDHDSITVNLKVVIMQEDGHFVAYCPALNLSSYGDTEAEAKEAFDEALEIFLEETNRKGTLEKLLLKLGWQLQQIPKPSYKPPTFKKSLVKSVPKSIFEEKVQIPVS